MSLLHFPASSGGLGTSSTKVLTDGITGSHLVAAQDKAQVACKIHSTNFFPRGENEKRAYRFLKKRTGLPNPELCLLTHTSNTFLGSDKGKVVP